LVRTAATPHKICEIKAVVADLPLLPVTAMKVAPLRHLAKMARHMRIRSLMALFKFFLSDIFKSVPGSIDGTAILADG
jgi:hypothetical protein